MAQDAALPQSAKGSVDFRRDVEPILHTRCYQCHGPSMQMNGLRFDLKEAAQKGGYSGPALVPGKSAQSLLMQRVVSSKEAFKMPPTGPALTSREIGILRGWIDQGAVWPDQPLAVTAAQKLSASEKKGHWAFQPIRRPDGSDRAPAILGPQPIDSFVLSRLEAEGISPSPEADKRTLLRRLSLDLIGLPPAPQEIDAFLTDSSPGAYERQVDRLLASSHYGERSARQWLDLARYADSDGYEKDLPRPYAWRWRQWVIEALNSDMPFDQFTRAQIAGDLLVGNFVEPGGGDRLPP